MMAGLAQQISTEKLTTQQALQAAFRQFDEAGKRLEQKYETLLKETKVLRAQLAAKEDEIKRAERLAMLGETAAGIAHEVRNPLGAIKLFVSLLKQDLQNQAGPLELVKEIEKSITSLDNVVSNILHFSKDAKQVFAPVNMQALLREQINQINTVSGAGSRIECEMSGNPYIQGHESGLRQAVYNLLLNAAQAAGPEGTVKACCRDGQEGEMLVTIADSGPGIPQAVFDRIFDPFVSTKNEGTGLGLAIVKRIVDQHKGEIRVRNCGGAEFTLVFKRRSAA